MSESWEKKRDTMRFNKAYEHIKLSHVEPLYRRCVGEIKQAVEAKVGTDLSEGTKQELVGALMLLLRDYCDGFAWAKAQVLRAEGHYETRDSWGT